jgi:fructose PTS system EIIBC or EIIC component
MKKIVAVTACPTGIAHTYMAAEALLLAAKALNVEIKVETHGAIGVENELTQQDIDNSIGVIIASDIYISKERFKNKEIIETNTRHTILDARKYIVQLLNK